MTHQLGVAKAMSMTLDLHPRDPEVGAGVETIWRILWRRRRQCASAFFLIALLGVAVLVFATPIYTAHTTMLVASSQTDLAATDQVNSSPRLSPSIEAEVESQIQLMSSHRALIKVAQHLKLNEKDDLPFDDQDWRSRVRALVVETWARLIEVDWRNLDPGSWWAGANGDTKAVRPAVPSDEAMVDFIKSRLRVQPIARSTTIEISFSAVDPELAARAANAVAENYIESRHAARVQQATRATEYLKERASQLLEEVKFAEKAVENARAANVLRDGRDIHQLAAEMEKVNAQLATTRIAEGAARAKLEAAETSVRQFGIVGALEPGQSRLVDRLREMAAEAQGRMLSTQIDRGSAHPDARKAEKEYQSAQNQVTFEAQSRISRLRIDVATEAKQSAMLESALQRLRGDYDQLSAALLTLRTLERQAAASRGTYEAFLARLKQTEQVGFNDAQTWIISPATVPKRPSFPNLLQIAIATMGIGGLASVTLAFLSEYKSRGTILSSEQIADRGLRALGIIPVVRRGNPLKYALAMGRKPANWAFSESVGSIATTTIALARKEQSAVVLLVTSSLPLEGKSTTATALAAKLARGNNRVLLIDADLRAPTLHRAFGIRNDRGLTDCLHPVFCVSDSLYLDVKTGITVLTAGPGHPEPQNVLRSRQLSEQMEAWRSSYDFIVVDSPPVLPVADARALAPLTDYCVFIACWRKTPWTTAAHALALLADSGVRLAGVVLSKVDLQQLAAYGFADSPIYGRAYRRYLAHSTKLLVGQ
jgi:capsular exopolysaccharide synthesis family protein